MLKIILEKAFNELDKDIFDLCRYINLEDIEIKYSNFGTTFEDLEKEGAKITLADISVKNKEINVNEFIFKRNFLNAKKYKIKIYRKTAVEYYKKAIDTVKHELLHLYLYEKYNDIAKDYNLINCLYNDENIIFYICCLILEIEHNNCPVFEEFNGLFDEFAELYRRVYGNDLYEFLHMLKLTFISEIEFAAFNYYTKLVYFHMTKALENFADVAGDIILRKIELWTNMLKIDLYEKVN